jgi:hypothetical protein
VLLQPFHRREQAVVSLAVVVEHQAEQRRKKGRHDERVDEVKVVSRTASTGDRHPYVRRALIGRAVLLMCRAV